MGRDVAPDLAKHGSHVLGVRDDGAAHAPTIGNAVAAWRDSTPRRHAWRAAVAIAVLERLVTFGYFIPRMVSLMGEPSAGPEVSAALAQWMALNHGRHVLTVSAWVAALYALSLSHARPD